MSWKSLAKYSLLAFVAVSVAVNFWQLVRRDSPAAEAAAAPVAAAPSAETARAQARPAENKVLVYYFSTTIRCPTCRRIEALSEHVVRTAFSDELRKGLIEFVPINVQLPQYRHFIRDYQLFTKSVVIVRLEDGRQAEWKNLERVWELVYDPKAFFRYLQDEIRIYLRKL